MPSPLRWAAPHRERRRGTEGKESSIRFHLSLTISKSGSIPAECPGMPSYQTCSPHSQRGFMPPDFAVIGDMLFGKLKRIVASPWRPIHFNGYGISIHDHNVEAIVFVPALEQADVYFRLWAIVPSTEFQKSR